MVVTLGQQYNIGEKPTVILYTYINHHAGTPEKQRKKQKQNKTWYIVIIYCYIGCEDEVTTLKREQMMADSATTVCAEFESGLCNFFLKIL